MDDVPSAGDGPEITLEVEDLQAKVENLIKKTKLLEAEKQAAQEEFGIQRAKLKEIYLQKEEELKRGAAEQNRLKEELRKLSSELDEAKSQLLVAGLHMESGQEVERKCQEEIATLQQLVHETFEESSTSRSKYENEVKHLRHINERLESEIQELRSHLHQQQHGVPEKCERDSPILAPGVMLSAVTKTLARKVASQLGADAASSTQDNLEDSMRKVKKYAQEDAEVLRSLVIPLEEEIQALKQKLRETDDQLRRYQGNMGDSVNSRDDMGTAIFKDVSSFQVKSPNRTTSLLNLSGVDSTSSEGGQQQFQSSPPKTKCKNGSTSSLFSLNDVHTNITKSSSEICSPTHDDLLPKAVTELEDEPKHTCDMCANYEAQLVRSQQKVHELEKQVSAHERSLHRYREDLAKESDFRKEMEEKWNEKKEEHKAQVAELKTIMHTSECALNEVRQLYTQTLTDTLEQLSRLTQDRERAQIELERLQAENDSLVGKHTAHSQQLQNEMINLPDKVEDLQELLLKFHEELIAAKVAKEAIEAQEKTLRCEIQLLRDQMSVEQEGRENMEDSLTTELDALKQKVHQYEREHLASQEKQGKLDTLLRNNQHLVNELKTKVSELEKEKLHLENNVAELKSRVGSLQQELDNAETVQQDFVRLSQSLQVQLEKIRSSDSQVRWQHEDDVEECPGCRLSYSITRKKLHCRHCGRIFCTNCLTHTVPSGPNNRPSKVCGVCHTLLVKDTAPYFSTEPPHTPD